MKEYVLLELLKQVEVVEVYVELMRGHVLAYVYGQDLLVKMKELVLQELLNVHQLQIIILVLIYVLGVIKVLL